MSRSPKLALGRDVIVFFEDRDRDTFVRGDRRLRRRLRIATAFMRPRKQKVSGFEMSFELLRRALKRAGQNVYTNAFALARSNPDFPIAVCGYPHILDHWSLPNPVVLGPGLFDHPKQAPALFLDSRFRSYLAFCDWMRDLFATVYDPEKVQLWFGAVDLDEWPDTRSLPKRTDVLVYDKIRWNRDFLVPSFRDPILAKLQARGLTFEVLRYGQHTHEHYRELLARSRSMLFLCEHETQGIAYQEALASNVPVLAWDQGFWLEPKRTLWEHSPVRASSVPYFSPQCGERFVGLDDFDASLARFVERLDRDSYEPRAYVAANLSMSASAEMFLRAYVRAGGGVWPAACEVTP